MFRCLHSPTPKVNPLRAVKLYFMKTVPEPRAGAIEAERPEGREVGCQEGFTTRAADIFRPQSTGEARLTGT